MNEYLTMSATVSSMMFQHKKGRADNFGAILRVNPRA